MHLHGTILMISIRLNLCDSSMILIGLFRLETGLLFLLLKLFLKRHYRDIGTTFYTSPFASLPSLCLIFSLKCDIKMFDFDTYIQINFNK